MQTPKASMESYRINLCNLRMLLLYGCVLPALAISGCGGGGTTAVNTAQPTPAKYFAPRIAGATLGVPQTYTIDENADLFSQTTYLLNPPIQEGPQVINAGLVTLGQRGLRDLGITAHYSHIPGSNQPYSATTYDPPGLPGSFAVELPGQTGALAQMVGQPAQPLVAATQCPNKSAPQTYLFVTIPAAIAPPGSTPRIGGTWDPTTETAYGTVDISSSGTTVNFQNIHQFTLPSVGGTGAPALPSVSTVAGTCAPTSYGNTITIPGQVIVSNPGHAQQTSGEATAGIGSSDGLLVEDNGTGSVITSAGTLPPLPYVNVLGAGTGAVGLPQPTSSVDTGSLVSAQYLGFATTAGTYTNASYPPVVSSHLLSLGFSNVPSTCAAITPSSSTLIYGGDFPKGDPTISPDGFGSCDFAINLGTQSASINGLYPGATVWVGAGYPGNGTGSAYSFPAVAVAGKVNSKYAIFVIGTDSTQPWYIHLLQSN